MWSIMRIGESFQQSDLLNSVGLYERLIVIAVHFVVVEIDFKLVWTKFLKVDSKTEINKFRLKIF